MKNHNNNTATLMNVPLFDALLSAGVKESQARKAAIEAAKSEYRLGHSLTKLESHVDKSIADLRAHTDKSIADLRAELRVAILKATLTIIVVMIATVSIATTVLSFTIGG